MGVLLREKQPLQQLHSKKDGGHISEGGLIFGRLVCMFMCYQLVSLHMLIRCLVHPYRKTSSSTTVWYEQSLTRAHMCVITQLKWAILICKSLVHCLVQEPSSYIVPELRCEGKYKLRSIIGTVHTRAHTHTHMHTPEYSLPCWCLPLDSLTYM